MHLHILYVRPEKGLALSLLHLSQVEKFVLEAIGQEVEQTL
jgi:hypothetical protein